MKVAYYAAKGSAKDVLKIAERHDVTPSTGEVRVKLHYSGINPSDVKMRAGLSLGGMDMPYDEVIPHSDGAGVVEDVGYGVTGLAKGDRVYVFNGGFKRQYGTAATMITLPADQVIPLPDSASFAHGACLGIPVMTAVHVITRAPSVEGKNVLVSSGGGVVGRYCIEVARALGAATIVATASSATSIATATAAGADAVLDYNDPNLAEAVMDHTGGIDHAVEAEFGVNAHMLGQVMKVNGSIAAYGSALSKTPEIPFYDFMFKNTAVHMVLVYLLDNATRQGHASLINTLLDDKAISENIAAIMPLDDIAAAHEMVEGAQKSGSVLLEVSST